MPVAAPSAVRRNKGIPGYTPEVQRLAAQLAELGIVVPQRQPLPRQQQAAPTAVVETIEQDDMYDFAESDETATDDLQEEIARYPNIPQRCRGGAQARHPRKTEHLPKPKPRRQTHWLLPLGAGMFFLLVLYVIVFFADLGFVSLTNRLSYGPNHISLYTSAIGDHDDTTHPTIFLATMLHGSVLVEELPGGDMAKAKAFTFPPLVPGAWGDMADIVVTVSPQSAGLTPTMLVKVEGDPQFGTLLARPTVTFLLVHTTKGYKYAGVLQSSG
jgi:hypothetical protein